MISFLQIQEKSEGEIVIKVFLKMDLTSTVPGNFNSDGYKIDWRDC